MTDQMTGVSGRARRDGDLEQLIEGRVLALGRRAARVYELVPPAAGLALALLVGALATALAVRWASIAIGSFGILGALLAPVLVGASADGVTLAFLFVAGLSAVGVLVWQRWEWLALAAFATSTAQWLWWWLSVDPSTTSLLIVLVGFGALGAGGAIGYELRVPSPRLRLSSSFLLTLNALTLAAAGCLGVGGGMAGAMWLGALGVVHVGGGVLALRSRRIAHDIGLLCLTVGVVLADAALGVALTGPARPIAYAGGALAFAVLARHRRSRHDDVLVGLGLSGHIALAAVQAAVAIEPETLWAAMRRRASSPASSAWPPPASPAPG